ncbi:hypothetical protein [Streptomyces sp. NPDC127190]|uniref:hypothetical protein n=1 Tax=Streptomyces sp. NPDC127190 TaxID=3345387 RepID=UPI00362D1C07
MLHNPERAHPGDRSALHHTVRDAFAVLEEAAAAGRVTGYGVATWAGLEEEAFTVGELLALAAEAAGGTEYHLAAVQLPVSLVMMTPIVQALHGQGPPAAVGAGLRVMASAPLHGGELPGIVDQELADLIRPGLTPAQACLLTVASCPGVTDVLIAASSAPHWSEAADAVAQPTLTAAQCGRSLVYSPPTDPDTERRLRVHHARAATALDVRVEPGREFWGWAGRTLGAPARTADGQPAWLRLVSAPKDKASGKLWDGALDAQHAFGDLDGHRPALLAVHDAVDDGTAYRAELSVRVDQPVLSEDPVLRHGIQLPDSWWQQLAGVLQKVAAAGTDRVAVRQQYMDRVIAQFVGIPAPVVTCWTTAHADVHWANLTASPLQLLDWEGWGRAPEGHDAATLYAYTLLQPDTAARVRATFPILGSPAGLAAEATVCAQLLQTVARGDNVVLEDQLRNWAEELRRR